MISDPKIISPIMSAILPLVDNRKASVLDIGCGFGTYSKLLRMYCDHHKGVFSKPGNLYLRGIDACVQAKNPSTLGTYDEITIDDITKMSPNDYGIKGGYDLVLMIDIVEHMEQLTAKKIIDELIWNGYTKWLLVSTPKLFSQTTPVFNKKYDKHVSHWVEHDFGMYETIDYSTDEHIIKLIRGITYDPEETTD